jgi:uncharacterized membrane protein YphA (DoxX/SURF4 family)
MEKLLARLKSSISFQLLTILVRYMLGTAFVWASILKIKGIRFEPQSGEHAPIHSVSHLLESMYQSGFYWYFIGWAQFLAGFLIMSQVFSTLGAVVYFPIILSICILTTAFEAPFFQLMTSSMLLANFYLLFWDWNRLKYIVLNKPGPFVDQAAGFSRHKIWTYTGIVLFLIITVYRFASTGPN